MKKLILTTLLLVISLSANAENNHLDPTFCEWLGDAATAVAQNRDKVTQSKSSKGVTYE